LKTTSLPKTKTIKLPLWLEKFLYPDLIGQTFKSKEEKVALAIKLSQLNIEHETGGPFGAVIFEATTHKIVSAAVNLVVPQYCSNYHAEMLAIELAQKSIKNHNFEQKYIIASSLQPCAMCLAAIYWSNIKELLYGAREEDAFSIGFDEGPLHPNWQQICAKKGIEIKGDIFREKAVKVLKQYSEKCQDPNSKAIIY
jgi:tRNA(Arg) A34 adenosine deaminase TadA